MNNAPNPVMIFAGSASMIIIGVLISKLYPSYAGSLGAGAIMLFWIGLAVNSANPGSFTYYLKRLFK